MIRTDVAPPSNPPQNSQPQSNPPQTQSNEVPNNELESVNLDDVPKLFKKKLSNYPDFKNKLKSIELGINEQKFISQLEIDKVIDFVKSSDELSLTSVVVLVMNELESFILKKKSGVYKKELAVRLLIPLFDGNRKVTDEFIENCMSRVRQIGRVRRVILRWYRKLFKKR